MKQHLTWHAFVSTETLKGHSNGSSSKAGKSGGRGGLRKETPRNSPTPTTSRVGKKQETLSREVMPKGPGQRSREVTPKHRGVVDKDWTPKSEPTRTKSKRASSSLSRLSTDGGDSFVCSLWLSPLRILGTEAVTVGLDF